MAWNRVTSSLMSERAAVRTISCGERGAIDRHVSRELAHAVVQPRFERRAAVRRPPPPDRRSALASSARRAAKSARSCAPSCVRMRSESVKASLQGALHRVERAMRDGIGARRRLRGWIGPAAAAAGRPASAALDQALLARLRRAPLAALREMRRSTRPAAQAAAAAARLTLTSTRPRAICRCTAARSAGSRSLRLAGTRSCRSR